MKKLILVILIILSLGLCVAVADENNSVKSLWQQFKAEQKIKDNEIRRIIKARSEGAKKLEKGLTKEAVKNLLGFPDVVMDNQWMYESTLIGSEGEVDKNFKIQIRFNSENKVDVFLSREYSTEKSKASVTNPMNNDEVLYKY